MDDDWSVKCLCGATPILKYDKQGRTWYVICPVCKMSSVPHMYAYVTQMFWKYHIEWLKENQ